MSERITCVIADDHPATLTAMSKLEADTRTQAVATALRQSLIS